jgi:cysteine desulfurase/selenocysteine lyase
MSAIIMSTPDAALPGAEAAIEENAATGFSQVPDAAVLEKLANAFFKANPSEQPVLPSARFSPPSDGTASSSAPQARHSKAGVIPGYSGSVPQPQLSGVGLPRSPSLGDEQPSALHWIPSETPHAIDLQRVARTLLDRSPLVPPEHLSFPTSVADAERGLATLDPTERVATMPAATVAREPRPELVPALGVGRAPFDPITLRRDFPILEERVHGRPLIWLDNAATTQKPRAVIDRLVSFYEHENSNIHRGAHTLAARATDAYEDAREKVARFLGASSSREIIFVRGATEGINLIAQSWGRRHVNVGDEIVITWLEHHANIVPWQQLCIETGARLRVAPVDDTGQIILEEYERLLSARTKLVAFTQVSNALGTVTPAAEMVAMAHRYGARVLVDGAQAVSHMPVNVRALNCDFYVFSGHKVFGPNGIGAVYGSSDILDAMPPWQGGGNMIEDVTFERTVYQPAPQRFEAGTGNIADAVGLGAAIDYLDTVGMANIARHEHDLMAHATAGLLSIPGLRMIGTAREKAGVISFVLKNCRPEDVGTALDRQGIAVRAGHHCAQPILRRFGVESSVRPSFALYNSRGDVDALVNAVRNIQANGAI